MEFYSVDQYRLHELYRWLNYEVHTMWLWGLVFIIPAGGIAGLLMLAAVVFTPYMLWTLYRTGRRAWIVVFLVIIGLPAAVGGIAVATLEGQTSPMMWWIWVGYSMIAFYSYTWVLRHQVRVWIERETWETQRRHRQNPQGW